MDLGGINIYSRRLEKILKRFCETNNFVHYLHDPIIAGEKGKRVYGESIGKFSHNLRIKSSLGCTSDELFIVLCTSSILLGRTGVKKISSLVYEFSPINLHFSDNLKSLISRLNSVYAFFHKISL